MFHGISEEESACKIARRVRVDRVEGSFQETGLHCIRHQRSVAVCICRMCRHQSANIQARCLLDYNIVVLLGKNVCSNFDFGLHFRDISSSTCYGSRSVVPIPSQLIYFNAIMI